jgi:hypothetical protein
MSRRSHAGRVRHGQPGRGHRDGGRPAPSSGRPPASRPTTAADAIAGAGPLPREADPDGPVPPAPIRPTVVPPIAIRPTVAPPSPNPDPPGPAPALRPNAQNGATQAGGPVPTTTPFPPADAGCTAPQLRRFIKSRAYVPMHELRRRFAINGTEDDVTQVALDVGRVYVGLPQREGRLLGELLRSGEVGYELSLDPVTPVVVGVYPMRPVPRS